LAGDGLTSSAAGRGAPTNVVFSNFVSARSLRVGLSALGQALFASGAAGPLVPALDREPRPGDRLFFTDEHGLGRYLGQQGFQFHPARMPWPLDDKLAFAEAVQAAGGDPVPFRRLDERASHTAFPVMLKGRRSWIDGRPHPRGSLCRTHDDIDAALDRYAAEGFARDGFYLQSWLPDGVTNCWSVAGWYDATRPADAVMLVTQKLAATRAGLGYALLVGQQADPAGLVLRTAALLQHHGYTGPFELEFLADGRTGRFHELEFNPRFWLQHSLLGAPAGFSLLRRYLGQSVAGTGLPARPVLWVSGIGLVMGTIRPFKREFRNARRQIAEWRRNGAQIVVDPPLRVAARLLAEDVLRRLRGRG
jgi:hypothetical protein